MKYKLIATDMDGTLLNDEHLISEGNIEAIKEIQKKGVKFVLASGRPSFAMFEYAKELKMARYGGYVRDLTQHLTTRADDSHAAPVFRLSFEHPQISSGFRTCQA